MGVPRIPKAGASAAIALLGAVLGAHGCARSTVRDSEDPDGQLSQSAAQRYIKRAIRSSSEGVIVLPSSKAEPYYDARTLADLAQAMRGPAAGCFVNRAIETIRPAVVDGEATFVDVPQGQLKLRVRVAPNGKVMRTELLESGFGDESMEACLQKVVERRRWPQTRAGNVQFMDLVFWASLGAQGEDRSEEGRLRMRKEQARAAVRAKECLQGRVDVGTYPVTGVNLVDREGATMVNRVEPAPLPKPVLSCIAQAFKAIRMPRAPGTFVRPVSPRAEFVVAADGSVRVADEEWLGLIQAEERAARAQERARLGGDEPMASEQPTPVARTPAPGLQPSDASGPAKEAKAAGDPAKPAAQEPAQEPGTTSPAEPGRDPGQGGLRLDLSGPRSDG